MVIIYTPISITILGISLLTNKDMKKVHKYSEICYPFGSGGISFCCVREKNNFMGAPSRQID